MSVTSGWGRLTWDQANWGDAVTLKTGWGAKAWGEDEWGQLSDAVAQPSGLSISASVCLTERTGVIAVTSNITPINWE